MEASRLTRLSDNWPIATLVETEAMAASRLTRFHPPNHEGRRLRRSQICHNLRRKIQIQDPKTHLRRAYPPHHRRKTQQHRRQFHSRRG
ncbi:hypothetical protein CASFOL_037549 [Castilleja foliolosa]|uniref:Uncharacterized protein n=1 Tax=Castilleja foliolosa TaxID=1961234 RepID=A0ABD3BP33_9LAMI